MGEALQWWAKPSQGCSGNGVSWVGLRIWRELAAGYHVPEPLPRALVLGTAEGKLLPTGHCPEPSAGHGVH